jgi:hypothetical protein
MALVLADRVKETTTTTGTSDFALGGAVSGFQTFSAGVGNSNTTYYSVALGSDWEVGLGTLSSDGLTLARTTVLQSSNSDTKVSFASGSKDIFVTYPADKSVLSDSTQTLSNKTLTNPTVTNYVETPYSANSSTAITLALTNGTVQIITLTGTCTITMPTATSGKSFIMFLKQDGTGSRTVTWSTVKWAGGTAPTITSTASRQDILSFFADGTNWYGVVVAQNYTP